MPSGGINGDRLRMARVIRGLSSPKLAAMINVSKQAIWQYENELNSPSPETMLEICRVLDFPYQFFQEGKGEYFTLGKSFCRTVTSTAKEVKEEQQNRNILRVLLLRYFLNYISFPSINMPGFTLADYNSDMEAFTNRVRVFYGLEDSPINNMANFIENIGIILSTYHHEADKFDALSQAPVVDNQKYRITVYNLENTTFARMQFTLAHELGHWLLGHIDSDEDTLTNEDYKENEKEANLFASCLLLPKKAFIQDLYNPTDLSLYVALKGKWKVSVATMIMRAHYLGLISFSQYQSLYRQLSKKGWRTSEPYDNLAVIPKPSLLSQAVNLLNTHNIVKKTDLVYEFRNHCFTAHQSMYEELLGLPAHTLDSSVEIKPTLKIINFKKQQT